MLTRTRMVIFCMLVGSILAAADEPRLEAAPRPENGQETEFRLGPAVSQSLFFVGIEHGFRLFQRKTRRELKGPFWRDYFSAASNLGGWDDGDSVFTNYIAHPMQGAVASYIYIHNDPGGQVQQISRSPAYWRSRFKAMAWSAAYNTQFELGPISEAAIGNVGKKPGTMGYVDLTVTPVGGFVWVLAEDALDRHVIQQKEMGTQSLTRRRLYRMVLNPARTFANLLRFKKPWHRDGRPISVGISPESNAASDPDHFQDGELPKAMIESRGTADASVRQRTPPDVL